VRWRRAALGRTGGTAAMPRTLRAGAGDPGKAAAGHAPVSSPAEASAKAAEASAEASVTGQLLTAGDLSAADYVLARDCIAGCPLQVLESDRVGRFRRISSAVSLPPQRALFERETPRAAAGAAEKRASGIAAPQRPGAAAPYTGNRTPARAAANGPVRRRRHFKSHDI